MRGYKMDENETVKQMAGGAISGNVIPMVWFEKLLRPGKRAKDGKPARKGKPHTTAIVLLADIVYWYRPMELRDETTGAVLELRKKFAADKLQRSYGQFADRFGFTIKQVRDAVTFLKKAGVIDTELRVVCTKTIPVSNVMYIGLNVDKLRELNAPHLPLGGTPSALEGDTYTEITTEISFKDSRVSQNETHQKHPKPLKEQFYPQAN